MNVLNSNTHGIDTVALNMISALLSASRGHARDDSLLAQVVLDITANSVCVRVSRTRARRCTIGTDCVRDHCDLHLCPRIADTRATMHYWHRLCYRSLRSRFVSASRGHARDDALLTRTVLQIIAISIRVRESPTRARRCTIGTDCIRDHCDLDPCPRIADTRAAMHYWRKLYHMFL